MDQDVDNGKPENESIEKLRVSERERQKCFRKRTREAILKHNRNGFSEVEKPLEYISLEQMTNLVHEFKKSKSELSLHNIQNAACFGDKHIEVFFKVNGALSTLVGILCCNDPEKQLSASTALTNLAAGPHYCTLKIAKSAGAYLVSFIKGDSPFLKDQCAWAAGNVANDCDKCFEVLQAQGLIPAVIALLESPYHEVVKSAMFALQACSRYESEEARIWVTQEFCLSLIQVAGQPLMLIDVLCVLSNVINDIVQIQPEVLHLQLCTFILGHLCKSTCQDSFDVSVATASVRCLAGLSTASGATCEAIFCSADFSNSVTKMMSSQYHHLRSELLLVLSNLLISAGAYQSPVDFCSVVESTKPFLCPLSSHSVQALYFFCVLLTTKKLHSQWFYQNNFVPLLEVLCNCGKDDVELAAKSFMSILKDSSAVL